MKNDSAKLKIIFTLLIFGAIFLLPKVSLAATINAASCSQADVQAAINSASNGDTVVVPAGSCIWPYPRIVINKSLAIIGAGIDVTTITGAGFKVIRGTDNWRISGFTFDNQWYTTDITGSIQVSGSPYGPGSELAGCKNFRIDHNKFMHYGPQLSSGCANGYSSIRIVGFSYGVIDNNQFYDSKSESIIYCGDGDASWTRGGGIGGYDNGTVFIEDNTWSLSTETTHGNCAANASDSASGSRVVFRYNKVYDAVGVKQLAPVETHGFEGLCSVSYGSSGYSLEVYNNEFHNEHTSTGVFPAHFRGGQGVAFNNLYYGSVWASAAKLVSYRSFCDREVQRQIPSPSYINAAGYSWYCHKDDGTENTVEGLVEGSLVYGVCHQQPNGIYVWDNLKDGNPFSNSVAVTSGPRYCANNETVSCTSDAQCPGSTCEVDYNSLDIVEGVNYFKYMKPGYTLYTYPHPLTIEADTTSPAAPTGVVIN